VPDESWLETGSSAGKGPGPRDERRDESRAARLLTRLANSKLSGTFVSSLVVLGPSLFSPVGGADTFFAEQLEHRVEFSNSKSFHRRALAPVNTL
jgi:hypothetical protein